MYILLALEAAVAAYGFWWLVVQDDRQLPDSSSDEPRRRLKLFSAPILLLALAFVAGLYTHYAFPVMVALLSVLYLVWVIVTRQRGQVGRRLLRWGLLLGIVLVCFAPWLGTAMRQITAWPTGGQAAEPLKALGTSLLMLSLGPTGLLSASEWWVWIRAGAGVGGDRPLAGAAQASRMVELALARGLAGGSSGDDAGAGAFPRRLSQVSAARQPRLHAAAGVRGRWSGPEAGTAWAARRCRLWWDDLRRHRVGTL